MGILILKKAGRAARLRYEHLTIELAQILSALDDRSARALERLVRDAMELARPVQANGAATVATQGWMSRVF